MFFVQLMTARETPPHMQTVEAAVDTAIASANPLTEVHNFLNLLNFGGSLFLIKLKSTISNFVGIYICVKYLI